MARRFFNKGELLLVLLSLLKREVMSEGEILVALDELLGRDYHLTASRILIGLGALEAEGLVDVATRDGGTIYRITPGGIEAVDKRAQSAVLGHVDRAGRADRTGGASIGDALEQVAILFTDVVGSTELLDRLGDDAAHQLRRRHFALLRRAVRDHGGREVKSLGDGLMVAFASPSAAVRCALAMQDAVAASADRLELRIGIASGEAAREEDDYFGRAVIVARRLCDVAPGGEVLISEPTPELVEGSAAPPLERLGLLKLKGLSEPVAASAMRPRSLALEA